MKKLTKITDFKKQEFLMNALVQTLQYLYFLSKNQHTCAIVFFAVKRRKP